MKFNLCRARKAAGLTQGELAKKIGVDIKTVGNWERENSYPNAEQVWNCAVALGCTPNDVLGWDSGRDGNGSQTLTAEEAEIVDCYRASAPQWQQNIAMTARAAAGESKRKPKIIYMPPMDARRQTHDMFRLGK